VIGLVSVARFFLSRRGGEHGQTGKPQSTPSKIMSSQHYTPRQIVKDFHSIDRFGYIDSLSKVDFGGDGLGPDEKSYLRGVSVNFGIVLGIGIVLTLVALALYCGLCCCPRGRFCKKHEGSGGALMILGEDVRDHRATALSVQILRGTG
jgi:hypothetical protein